MKLTSSPSGGGCRGTGSSDTPTPAAGPKPTPFYQDQYVTLYCGDCREIVTHLDGAFDLLLTDPPYSRVVDAAWDKLDRSQLCELLDKIFQMVRPKLADNAAVYVFAWPSFSGKMEHIMSRYFNVLQHIVWNKQEPDGRKNGTANRANIASLRNFFTETERIIFAEQFDAGQLRRRQWECLRRPHAAKRNNFTDLWNYRPIMAGSRERCHPCQKPLPMLVDMIETSTRPSGLVLDCFAGSGQTAIAARKSGRRCVLIEQEPQMCEIIAARLVNYQAGDMSVA